ncbi:MAG: outer membrane lipoprotein-sorting protein [Gammaproteobacteria bacterium]|jgi:outer membrane lipoprotein-sorting protein
MRSPISNVLRPYLYSIVSLLAAGTPFTAALAAHAGSNKSAEDILRQADAIRFPQMSFETNVTITTRTSGGNGEIFKYRVLSRGNDKTLVITTAPATDRGQILLMSGRDLWVYMPTISQPIRLPLARRLTGQVANGDLARANFTGDYNPKILRTEAIGGQTYYVLELMAVDRSVTYHRVVYWVNRDNSRPYKAQFYTLSGRLMKTCLYQNFKSMAGKSRPTRLVMTDALHKGEQSILEYSHLRLRNLPDKYFTKDYLKKLN